jgi:hypothetical protein
VSDIVNWSAEDFLARFKGLTLAQYDATKEATKERVHKLIKEKPTRKALEREQGSLLGPLDVLAVIVFIAALLVSSIHILTRMGELAGNAYQAGETILGEVAIRLGIVVSEEVFVVGHQLGFILLAEASMLLFMVTWRMSVKDEERHLKLWFVSIPRKIFSVYLLLALLAMTFVLVSNLESGLTLLEAVMPPFFTIGLGLHMEHLIVTMLERKTALDLRYTTALDVYEKATEDVTTHPEYARLWKREIWEKLSKLKDNQELADASPRLKMAAVRREQLRDEWMETAQAFEEHVQSQATNLGLRPEVVERLEFSGSGGLPALADLVAAAPDGLMGDHAVIKTDAGTANLEELTWTDTGQNGRVYGPYSSRTKMAGAIRSVYKTNTKRS